MDSSEFEYRSRALALGGQLSRWGTGPARLHGGIGVELRIERITGKDFETYHQVSTQPPYGPWNPPGAYIGVAHTLALGTTQTWQVRPYVRAFTGWRGILLPAGPWGSLLWAMTQGSERIYPITRLEVGIPVGRRGGEGPSGLLRQMAPGPEMTISFGVRAHSR